jgi:MoxR-like ATPase
LIHGRWYVVPDDFRALARQVLAHRVVLHPDAELDGLTGVEVVERALRTVRYSQDTR